MKFYICSCFLAQVWLFCLLQCFDAETGGVTFHIFWNYYIPSWIPHLQSHKRVFVERALPRQSSTTAHVFRLGLTLRPTPVFQFWNWWGKFFCSIWKYYIPSCIPHLQSHKRVFVERALPRQSSTTAHVFRLGLTLLPTTMFCWCHWWEKVSKHMKLLHPLLHSPLADPQTNLYRESSAT